jgi:hypothetical protein
MEIKASWKILGAGDDAATFYSMPATVDTVVDGKTTGTQDVTLGLVGFHLVINTANHPEFVWATFEHKQNAPLCDGTSAASGWSFASDAAAECLDQSGLAGCSQYGFNVPTAGGSSTGLADQVCRLFDDGTDPEATAPNTNNNAQNEFNIDTLNDQLVGPAGFLTTLDASDPMQIWSNYFLVGGLWLSQPDSPPMNPSAPSAVPYTSGGSVIPASSASFQRGSLELTNMTMETFEQGSASPVPNCFACHGYDPAKPLEVSHIIDELLPASALSAP